MSQPRLNVWILAVRPKTLWAAIAPVLMGTAMAFESGVFHWLAATAALLGAVMIQIGTNFANDYFDYSKGTDRGDRLGPIRVTQAGMVKPATMKAATTIVFMIAFLLGCYLVYRGGWPVVIIGLLSILFGLLYTGGPFPLGYNGLGDLFVLIFFGPVAAGGTYYVQSLTIEPEVLVAGLSPGLFSVAILTVNNLRDIRSDASSGKRTLQVLFGEQFARWEFTLCIIIGSLVPIMMWFYFGSHPYAMVTVLVPLVAIGSIRKVFTLSSSPEFNNVLAATGKLLLLYSLLFSVGWLL